MPESRIAPGSSARREAAGVVTILFTDVEGSTRLWEESPDTMRTALRRHDELLRTAIDGAGGEIVKTTGDGLMAVFASASGALEAAVDAQLAMLAEPWPDPCSIRVRMGIHSGEAELRGGDYFGRSVNRAARIMAAGHGGQVLVSAATAALAGDALADGSTLRDLGEHRLKDLDRPERLFQLLHPGLPGEFPALGTLDLRPSNLPTHASEFVGREGELEAIRRRLGDDGVRLLTLTGPGGSGKTRLALRAAADQADRFADGVFFVDLSTATGADAVVALIAGAIGLGDSPERSPLDELKARLRPLRMLLVIDNFEQVTTAAATLVELLEHGPGLTVLVTSREALRVRGEHLLTVPPMALPEATAGPATAADLGRFEAIQLFVARARAANPAFNLTDDNAAAIAEICRRLDGLPLAIELATARLNLYSPDALLGRLESRLAVLRGGARDLPLRQQTMRATIEWSYLLLDPPEQRVFELMSVFSGATPDLMEAVADGLGSPAGVDAVDGLGSLLDKSLVRQAVGGAAREPRIVMLETIREYASERLAAQPDFAAAVREAHAVAFAELAARATAAASADPHADGHSPTANLLTDELDNLRAAWRHWVGARDLGRLEQLEDGLWASYEARGWYHATIELIRDHLDVLADAPATPERWEEEVTLRTSLGRALTLLRGYTGEAEDAYLAALALFEARPEGPRRRMFPVLRGLSSFYGFRGEFEKGIAVIHEILRLADEQGDASMRIDGMILLGGYTTFTGRVEEGLAQLQAANREAEAGGYRTRRLRLGNDLRVTGLTTAGFVLWLLGRPDQALDSGDRAIALARQLDHPYSLAYALYHVGFLHVWRREPELVRDRALEVLRLAETNDLPLWRALGRCLLGAATSTLGDPRAGLDHIAAGLDLYGGLRTPPVFWPLVRYLEAGAMLDADEPLRGLPLVAEALALAGEEDIISPLFGVLRGDLLLALDPPDVDGARASYDSAARVAAQLGTPGPLLLAEIRRLRVALPVEREERAAGLRAVLETFEEGRSAPDALEAERLLAGG